MREISSDCPIPNKLDYKVSHQTKRKKIDIKNGEGKGNIISYLKINKNATNKINNSKVHPHWHIKFVKI